MQSLQGFYLAATDVAGYLNQIYNANWGSLFVDYAMNLWNQGIENLHQMLQTPGQQYAPDGPWDQAARLANPTVVVPWDPDDDAGM